jgi:hypothetical protein
MDISNIVFLLNHFVYIVYNGNVIFSFIKKKIYYVFGLICGRI